MVQRKTYCLYSTTDAAAYSRTAIRPSCRDHEHISRDEAHLLTGTVLYTKTLLDGTLKPVYEFDYVRRVAGDNSQFKLNAITCLDPRRWGIARSGGRFGMEVHQLIPCK